MKIWKWIKSKFKKEEIEIKPPSVVVNPIPVVITPGEASYLPYGVSMKPEMRIELEGVIKHGVDNKEKYLSVERQTGVPWRLIVGLHYRESSLNFKGVLHNGEYILGTGKKTKLVPAGRGPFSTWEEAAIDALFMKKSIFPREWTAEACHEFCERFNGLGYRNKGIPSPYVWAGTTKYKSGLYVSDGKFSSSAIDRRLGTACIMEGLKNY